MMICKYRETPTFHFHNANPKGKNANDCVARAISVALSQSWEQTIREMTELGIKLGLAFNEDKCIDAYLKQKGWLRYPEPRDLENKKYTVERLLKKPHYLNEGVVIAKVGSHHITLIVDGVVWDTWDCTKQTIHRYFKNPNAKTPEKAHTGEKRRFTL